MYISFGLSHSITDVNQIHIKGAVMYNWWLGHVTKEYSREPNILVCRPRSKLLGTHRSSETKVHEHNIC